ncbi:tripartite tricarboxylate transporter substrate binding protein [Bordetella sp. BOR01]|uniref:Bug family tripartite tricarboxylate transporter substrate binding protein n=1 Tax=Bordetella sp. BOR01 TaxID=2854779 RepID=UPI001C447CC0|nr:tripartite tricarboxylate transporter substrate binding protein [Bordetella sp. BOR01]MBV7482952.1 tripartite tricarboxylate transporter substrate binding protein [Bordetella sp. BOR01]
MSTIACAIARRAGAGLILACCAFSGLAWADSYPSRSVRVVVPFAPGASTDMLARLAADELGKRLGQSFVVENVTGAGGTIGAHQVARAAPDGYTLLAATPGPITISPVTRQDIPYDPAKSLAAITLVAQGPGVLAVSKDSPYHSVKDLIAAGQDPAKPLKFGSAGIDAFSHLSGAMFTYKGGIQALHVPYRGSGPALLDLIAGRLDFEIEYFPAIVPHMKSGALRALAVTSKERSPLSPDLPTINESGVPGYESGAWVGLMAPAGTPRAIIDKLQQAMAASLKDPAVAKRIRDMGVLPGGNTPDEYAAYIASETGTLRELVKNADVAEPRGK